MLKIFFGNEELILNNKKHKTKIKYIQELLFVISVDAILAPW